LALKMQWISVGEQESSLLIPHRCHLAIASDVLAKKALNQVGEEDL